jgi:Sec-independent protein translocase protein TatA
MTPPHGGFASIGLPQLLVLFFVAILLFGVSRLNR